MATSCFYPIQCKAQRVPNVGIGLYVVRRIKCHLNGAQPQRRRNLIHRDIDIPARQVLNSLDTEPLRVPARGGSFLCAAFKFLPQLVRISSAAALFPAA